MSIYVLHNKSQATSIFLHFDALIERKFNAKIKQLHNDGGTKFKSLKNYLFREGYTRRISCPYTPTQYGVVERRNRHNIETSLAMRIRASMSMKFLDYGFKFVE